MNLTEDCMALVINAIGLAKRVKEDNFMPSIPAYGAGKDMDVFDIASDIFVYEVLSPSWLFGCFE